jgi:hypothetical protein
MYVKRNIEALSRKDCCRGKAISITYSECVFVDLFIQHAERMRRIICLWHVWFYYIFFIFSHKRHGFGKKKLLNKNACFIFCTTFV